MQQTRTESREITDTICDVCKSRGKMWSCLVCGCDLCPNPACSHQLSLGCGKESVPPIVHGTIWLCPDCRDEEREIALRRIAAQCNEQLDPILRDWIAAKRK